MFCLTVYWHCDFIIDFVFISSELYFILIYTTSTTHQ